MVPGCDFVRRWFRYVVRRIIVCGCVVEFLFFLKRNLETLAENASKTTKDYVAEPADSCPVDTVGKYYYASPFVNITDVGIPEDGKTPDGSLTVGRKGTNELDTASSLDLVSVTSDFPIDDLISTSYRDASELVIT